MTGNDLAPNRFSRLFPRCVPEGSSTAGQYVGTASGEISLRLAGLRRTVSVIAGGADDGNAHQSRRLKHQVQLFCQNPRDQTLRSAPTAGDYRRFMFRIVKGGAKSVIFSTGIIVGQVH